MTLEKLLLEAAAFAEVESTHPEPTLFGVTDGKAVGTYFEHKFQAYLARKYEYRRGSSAKGIDFPELNLDVKVTSVQQPQSSCPFRSARRKVYGLGYSLLVFAYRKTDDPSTSTGILQIQHLVYVREDRTADYQTTRGIRELLDRDANEDDLVAFMEDRFLPADDITARELAREIMSHPPQQGYLTMSNALQWRLQYQRIIDKAGEVEGVQRIR